MRHITCFALLLSCVLHAQGQTPPLKAENDSIGVSISSAAGKSTCQFFRPVDGSLVLKDVGLGETEVAAGKSSVETASHPAWGKGKTIVQRTSDGQTRVSVYEKFPFAVIQKSLVNKTNAEIAVNRAEMLQGVVDLGLSNEELCAASTAGLQRLTKASQGYAYMVVGDPQTHRGLVCGWLTHDRGSGAAFAKPQGDQATLSARIDYGDLRIPAGAKVPSEILLVGYFDDVRRGLEQYADALAAHYEVKLPEQPVFYMTWYNGGASDENRIRKNAAFIKKNLTPYGLDVMQIDDKWQVGSGRNGPKRNFTKTDPKVYPSGMKVTADRIHAMGLTPGIWYLPFAGTWDAPYWKDKNDWFVKQGESQFNYSKAKGKELPYEVRWGGTCLDLTNPKAVEHVAYLADLLSNKWNYKFFKMDGLWTGIGARLQYVNSAYVEDDLGQPTRSNPSITPIEAFRSGLKTVRKAAGEDVFLLGCSSTQNMRSFGASFGLVDAMRVGPDNGAGREPGQITTAVAFASRNFWQEERLWYVDPDSFSIRDSVDLTMTRSYFSWITLCGMLNNTSVSYADLSPARLDLLRRTMPSHRLKTVNPVDFLEHEPARIWTLKDTQAGPERMVIGLFNWGTGKPVKFNVPFAKLGLDPAKEYVGFDYWGDSFLSPFKDELEDSAGAMDCRILSVKPVADYPQVVGTSRHITQGSVDLLAESWDASTMVLSGRSRLVAGDDCEFRIAVPWKEDSFKAISAELGGASGQISQKGPMVRVTFVPSESDEVDWSIRFEKATLDAGSLEPIKEIAAQTNATEVRLAWDPVGETELKVLRTGDGETVVTSIGTNSVFRDGAVELGQAYTYQIVGRNWKGVEKELASVEVRIPEKLAAPPTPPMPDIRLTDLKWISASTGHGKVEINRNFAQSSLLLDGVEYKNGLGTHARSLIVYDIPEGAKRFVSLVGVDDRMRNRESGGTVKFRVMASVREMGEKPVVLGESPVLSAETLHTWSFDVALAPRLKEIRLEVDPADKGDNSDHANWCNPGFMK